MATPHLPEDILLQIVQRLPLISVLRWKRVSKQWKHLINDPSFYKSYQDNSNRTAVFGGLDSLYFVFTNDSSPYFTSHRLTFPLSNCKRRSSSNTPKFLGSSYGMACFKEEDGPFLVYNCFTGSLYTVANVPNNRRCPEEYEDHLRYYGFGYDGYGDDYKILVYHNESNPREGVWIYSFTNKDWNSFQAFPYHTFPRHTKDRIAYSVNGVLHWLLLTFENKRAVIVTYDLHTNRFGEIQVPPTTAVEPNGIEDYWCSTVAELNGQLCYVVGRMGHRRMIVWVMKQYGGVGDSWERLWTIDCDLYYSRRMVPTTLLSGGRLVLFVDEYEFKQELIWYNIDENKETEIGEEQQKGKYDCWKYFAICFLFVCITLICIIYLLSS